MGRRSTVLIGFVSLIFGVFAAMPKAAFADYEIDMPFPSGFVNDYANIIDNDEELEEKLVAYEERTTNELAVLTVEDLQGYNIDEFTSLLWEKVDGWQWGKEDKDNGVMIVIAPNERKWRIEVGYGLQGTLTNGLAGLIGEYTMKPYFVEEQYSEGINAGVDAVISVLDGNTTEDDYAEYTEESHSLFDVAMTLLCCGIGGPFAFLSVFQSILYRSKGIWLGGVLGGILGGAMTAFFWSELGYWGILLPIFGIPTGVFADWVVEKSSPSKPGRKRKWWYSGPLPTTMMGRSGGGGFSGGGGGFSGGGGGSSGGGGASGGW